MVPEEVGLWKRVKGWESRSRNKLRGHIHVAEAETLLIINGWSDAQVLIWRLRMRAVKTEVSFLGKGEGAAQDFSDGFCSTSSFAYAKSKK